MMLFKKGMDAQTKWYRYRNAVTARQMLMKSIDLMLKHIRFDLASKGSVLFMLDEEYKQGLIDYTAVKKSLGSMKVKLNHLHQLYKQETPRVKKKTIGTKYKADDRKEVS